MAASINPVILSGGSGTRLWPLSRTLFPKQFLPLVSESTMLVDTARRTIGPAFAAPMVICNVEHRFLVAEQLRGAGIAARRILLEPRGRNTAPAAAMAALLLTAEDPEALMLLLPSDHAIGSTPRFLAGIELAAAAARGGALVTFGIRPTAPRTGYGYIQVGPELAGLPGCNRVSRFVEKPDAETAAGYLAGGRHLWNSGMFLFSAQRYLAELERHRPDILAACRQAVAGLVRDLDFDRLPETFADCPADSIDYAVMERTGDAAVIEVEIGWSDIGSWSALWEIGERDADGNVRRGEVVATGVRNSYLRSEGPLLVTAGLDDMVIVATSDAVLVVPRDQAEEVKPLVEMLKESGRRQHHEHPRVLRPWGSYQSIDIGDQFQVKRIIVTPGGRLSLQKHAHRAEHWVVVRGVAHIRRGDDEMVLQANQSVDIPIGAVHRLENRGSLPLDLIEIQTGSYLGEDDIVRLEDVYGRS